MTGRPDWRSSTLLATTVVGIACAALVAFITIDPPPLPAKRAKAPTAAAPPARAAEVKVPLVEPPAAPSGTDFSTRPIEPPAPAAAAPAKPEPAKSEPAKPDAAIDWAALPIEDLRTRANSNDLTAMEELARRLIQGVGVAKDPQAGAGWLLRAAEGGSVQAAFNVGVMYERGFVVERDSSRAVEWYRRAAEGSMPAAKHNLALLLRDGKGAPRDAKRAIELLQAAARQGMAASMFSLGDMYERGDGGVRDPAAALAWFAIAAEFERQINHGEDTALAKTAEQRARALQGVLTPAELKRAQQMGQTEFHAIADALAPPKPSPPAPEPAAPAPAADAPPPPPATVDLPSWPKAAGEQVRAVQQALVDLRLLRDKPDGVLGPMTRNAIREFQRSAGLKETGEPGKDVYVAMRQAQAKREVEATSPLPLPPKQEATKPEPAKPDPAGQPTTVDLGKPEPPPPPPTATEIAGAAPKAEPARNDASKPVRSQPVLKIAAADPPPPPTSIDIARAAAKADPNAWPPDTADQIKAIQRLLGDLKILGEPADGQLGDKTRSAIRHYQKLAGLKETGEPSKTVFESLKETLKLMAPRVGLN